MAQEIGAAVIGLVSWELKGLLLHWKPITGAPVRNRRMNQECMVFTHIRGKNNIPRFFSARN